MKKLFACLLACIPGLAMAEAPKLGANDDQIRQMLFANQPMKELLSRVQLDGKPGPFQTIADASKLVDSGKTNEAIAVLHSVLKGKDIETRVQLWVWSCLRELGENPDSKSANEVLGVILEIPSGGGYDTLAAYADGTARYLNFSGAAIFWDVPDVPIKNLCLAFVESSIPVSKLAKPRLSLTLPKRAAQLTLLTRSGNYVVVEPPQPVVDAGYSLMMALMKHTKKNG